MRSTNSLRRQLLHTENTFAVAVRTRHRSVESLAESIDVVQQRVVLLAHTDSKCVCLCQA